MKKVLLSLICVAAMGIQVNAQKWVSTSPQNKNVVLEEFTGIHCGYCPDGHRIANQMVAANPGRIFLINIHSGSFAVPQAGELDLRTDAGTAIDGSAGITGYPAGSVNRANTPWGQSRSAWSSLATNLLSQTSPVNVAVKSYVDFATRKLTTEVEVYYTSNSAQATNYLTVALTQDDILGTQTDYGNYNPTNWVNGLYKHNHVLRQLITAGNFGELIDTTTKGHYFYKKFETTIPDNYKGVNAILYKMNVVAFVSETKGNILSAAETKVDFDPSLKTDLSLTDLTVKPTSYCFTSINPKIEVTNNLDQVVTTFDVSCMLNGVEYKKTFNGSLAKGQKTTLDWGNIAFAPTGAYKVDMVGFKNVNGGLLFDMTETNDMSTFSGFGFKAKAFTNFLGTFEGGLPANSALDLSTNPNVKVITGTTVKYGVYNSPSSLLFYLHNSWNVAGKPGHLLIGEADLTSFNDPAVGYYYAYSDASYGGTAPTIGISVSTDCGANWTPLGTTTCKETGQPTTAGNLYDPKAGEYKQVITSLAAYKGKNVLIKVSGTPGTHGNAMYIDDIRINNANVLSTSKIYNNPHVNLYPNPVNGVAEVSYELAQPGSVTFNVYNMLNQLVYSKTINNQSVGAHAETFNFSDLNSGVYTLSIASGDAISTKKFIKN
jgi:hypothetical protein